jgi:two-component system cell cycle sensor histidine kinase/response regulator CckA
MISTICSPRSRAIATCFCCATVREDSDFADLEQIRQNANRAAALVSQLLAFSRKQTLKPERLELHDVLSEVTHLLNRLVGEKVELSVVHDPRVGPVRADRGGWNRC